MDEQAGDNRAAKLSTGKAVSSARASIWKSTILIAPLAGAALVFATGTNAQASGNAAPANSPIASTLFALLDATDAAGRGGPKVRDKVGRTLTPPAPDAQPDAQRRGGPKGDGDSGRTEVQPMPDTQPAARGGKPKPDKSHGLTEAPISPEAQRKGGPKGDSSSDNQGRTEVQPTPDTQPAARGTKPKGDKDHGRTATTPLIIGALGAAAIVALVVSSGSGTPVSR